MKQYSKLTFQNGMAYLGENPRLLVSADYPYYRDLQTNWRDRLQSLKNLGIEVISIYIPWRHHQLSPNTKPDFRGATQANRDVLQFLSLCAELDLMVIAKPGPFIHAEVNFGGLPNWTCPENNSEIGSLLNWEGKSEVWSGAILAPDGKSVLPWPLPAPSDPQFLELTRQWMTNVGEEVIKPYCAPNGPIVAVQVGNEGFYSNGQHAPWDFDFSPSALKRYREHLRQQYTSLENYNTTHVTNWKDWAQIQPPRKQAEERELHKTRELDDWGIFQADSIAEIFNQWYAPLATDLIAIVNQNPPYEAPYGLDAWLTRAEPERWKATQYGFTNWVGDVSANPSAFDRYILTAKRYPGVNMEENWGFAELYDPAYVDASTSFYQTLAILNNGATGFNVYTGVGTSHADANMEILKKAPYPDAAPIGADGEITPKAEIAGWMARFFNQHGVEFLECRSNQSACWALYLPYARKSAWAAEPPHGESLREFQRQMRLNHLDYGILNLESASLSDLLSCPHLYLSAANFMDAETQLKLAKYVRGGGKLFVIGQIPRQNEAFQPCDTLWTERDQIILLQGNDLVKPLEKLNRPNFREGNADIWIREHPSRDVQYLTLLIPAHGKPRLDVSLELGGLQRRITLTAAASGGALLRIENGRITDAIIKGHNAYLGVSVPPVCQLDNQSIGLASAGDFLLLNGISNGLRPL